MLFKSQGCPWGVLIAHDPLKNPGYAPEGVHLINDDSNKDNYKENYIWLALIDVYNFKPLW